MIIRSEMPFDISAISKLIKSAFIDAPYSSGKEAAIVDGLRENNALTVSLVCEDEDAIVGYVAFSSVSIAGEDVGWFGLGPVAVRLDKRRQAIAQILIKEGLERIKSLGAQGCVVLGDPSYYARFGFKVHDELYYQDVPKEYFQALIFDGEWPKGNVEYHKAFSI